MNTRTRARWFIAWCAVAGIFTFTAAAAERPADHAATAESSLVSPELSLPADENAYARYIETYQDAPRPSVDLLIEAEHFAQASGSERVDAEGASGKAVVTDESGEITWEVDVQESGLYHISIRYFPVEGRSAEIERALLIDGELPFAEAGALTFPRLWADQEDSVRQDSRGNDLRPSQVEVPSWQEAVLEDKNGTYTEPYLFYFSKGKHTITLQSVREPMMLDVVRLIEARSLLPYREWRKQHQGKEVSDLSDFLMKVQGEDAAYKSSPTLYPLADRSSPVTEPFELTAIKWNTIGGINWRIPGQSITWKIDVPQDGFYQLAVKYRQHFVQAAEVSRRLKIDGEVPFAEAGNIRFPASGGWQMLQLGDGKEPYLFYLTEGEHTLTLEVTLGELAPILDHVEHMIFELNDLYRKIIMITGSTPDPFRDYQLEKQIPDLRKSFAAQAQILHTIIEELERQSGGKGERTAVLNKVAFQLDDLAKNPESIIRRLEAFKSNIVALGTWTLTAKEMPLEIDYIVVASEDAALPKANASWFANLLHGIRLFAASFVMDVDRIGTVEHPGEAVEVWVTTGRDQAQIIKMMIESSFTPQTGIPVNLQLVDETVVLPATLAGAGPDVALSQTQVVDFAMRGALQDLSVFDGFEEVQGRFMDSAFVPFRYEGGVYAIPEQQTFPMMFYRTDVLAELEADVPQTWEDLYELIPVLNKQQLNIGLTPEVMKDILLFQAGGEYYLDGGKRSGLASEEAIRAFKDWTYFYTHYKVPQQFDFLNRFRIGEMPIGIAEYTTFNSLVVFAPEIRGLWEFAPVPGTMGENGEIHREVSSKTLGTVMFKSAKNKEHAWKFIQWWSSKEAQLTFGRELEALMGASARYPAANLEALRELPWSEEEYRRLSEQLKWVRGIPEVPGGYFTERHLNNAFFAVLNDGANPRETLKEYVRVIDQEITIKRQEFGLPTD